MTSISKVDKLEVTKLFPNLKRQLLHKLEDIALQVDWSSSFGHCTYIEDNLEDMALQEERRLEENATVLATQVLLQSKSNIIYRIYWNSTQATSINKLAEELLAVASALPLDTLLATRCMLSPSSLNLFCFCLCLFRTGNLTSYSLPDRPPWRWPPRQRWRRTWPPCTIELRRGRGVGWRGGEGVRLSGRFPKYYLVCHQYRQACNVFQTLSSRWQRF